ncbi:MAG: M55 family metallopeptidase [Armatimonadetes bacterium]|nr:M55 family metallopeptidase [Armatimonadota bacterium]
MKVYIVTDLEGVAGVWNWDNRTDDTPYIAARRARESRWLMEEVNAAARGFFAGGATEVIVNDGHGAGATMDLSYADPRITIFHGLDRPDYCTGLDETCDAIASVGTHAKAGTEGANLRHTMGRSIRGYWINDVSVGETGYQAFLAGYYGVPFIFCAGDAWACKEMQELCPGCVAAPVKYGCSELSALTHTPQRAREIIEEAAERAMGVIDKVEPLDAGSPVVFREEFYEPTFDPENPPAVGRVIDSHTREIEAANMEELMDLKYGFDPEWQPFWKLYETPGGAAQ